MQIRTGLILAVLAAAMGHAVLVHAEKVVKIGYAGPLTGELAHLGKDAENGVRAALDEANDAKITINGEPVRFVLDAQDDQADPKTAVLVAQRLVDDGISGMVGHLTSGATLPASRVYAAAGIPQISQSSTNPLLTRQGFATAFRVIGDDQDVGSVIANYALDTLHATRIAVIDDRTVYGQGLADSVVARLGERGVKPVARDYTTDQAVDFKGILTSLKSAKPDVIIYGGVDGQAGPMRKQLTELGLDSTLFGSSIETDKFIELAGPTSEGTYSAESGYPLSKMPKSADFERKFAKYGQPVLYSPYAYDATWALIRAMQAANSTGPHDYLPALRAVNFDGVTGHIQFDQKGDLRAANVTIYQARQGKFNPVTTVGIR
ncbi:branched-chain amino acid transport system substrate-binding protein [Paraburkholderia sp. UCT70]|uniref:branched-chain amino acid ABC transporter substrate-binding protein n=1 Tax=Paraburkholderia sp. UCT70 TaxID=2991068 RepID=UPI003D1A903F